jgi:hypothetical protein
MPSMLDASVTQGEEEPAWPLWMRSSARSAGAIVAPNDCSSSSSSVAPDLPST